MIFTPKNEEELAIEGLLPEGTYDFEVIEAVDKVSRNGNDMIALKLKVYDQNGGFRFITDYLLEAFLPKLLSFAVTTGTRRKYDQGDFASDDCQGCAGKVQIKIVPAGDYPAKNEVKMYGEPKAKTGGEGKSSTQAAPATFKPSSPALELEDMDDIPF